MKSLIKQFFKTTLIAFIGMSLIHTQTFSGIVIPQAVAQAESDAGNSSGNSSNNADPDTSAQNVQSEIDQSTDDYEDPDYRETRTHENEDVGDTHENDSFSVDMITMYVIGFITAGLASSCQQLTWDMGIAIAGGIAYLAGEVMAKEELEEANSQLQQTYTVDSKDLTIQNEQYDSLKKQKEAYEEVVSTLETKLNLQYAADAAFLTSMGMSLTQESTRLSLMSTATVSGGTICASSTGSNCCMETAGCAAGLESALHIPKDSNADLTTIEGYCTSFSACGPVNAYCQTLTNSMLAVCNPGQMGVVQSRQEPSPLERILNIVTPQAHATDYSALLTTGGAMLMAKMISSTLGVELNTFFGTPSKRAIAFGILSALTIAATVKTQEAIDQAEENIEKIDEILNNLSKLPNEPYDDNSRGDGGDPDKEDIDDDRVAGSGSMEGGEERTLGEEGMPCMNGEQSDGSCPSIEEQNRELAENSNFGLSGSMSSSAQTSSSLADDINGSNSLSQGSIDKANELSKKRGAIRKRVQELKDQINNKRKGEDLPPIDFNKREEELKSNLRKATQKGLKESGISANEALASLGLPKKQKQADKGKDKKQNTKKVTKSKAKPKKKEDSTLDLGLDEEENSSATTSNGEQSAEEMAGLKEGEEFVMDDINKKKETSIFQIISVRYLKSGYERLSEDKKVKGDKSE